MFGLAGCIFWEISLETGPFVSISREVLADVLAFACWGFPQSGKDFLSSLLALFPHAYPVFPLFLAKIRGFFGYALSFGRGGDIGCRCSGFTGGKGECRREKNGRYEFRLFHTLSFAKSVPMSQIQ
jgi:hypothetical protein